MAILVLGAYGLIGAGIVNALLHDNQTVIGFGRDPTQTGKFPTIQWRLGDLNSLTDARDWYPYLEGINCIINASGALQDGIKDHLEACQHQAITALIKAAGEKSIHRFIQISAPDARPDHSLPFLATKGKADAYLRSSKLNWVIFKPGLVIAVEAYGGTALLRQLASIPYVQPLCLPNTKIQTVALQDVAHAVTLAVNNACPIRQDYPLVTPQILTLKDIVLHYRQWLGSGAACVVSLPAILCAIVCKIADALSWLGWRSPLRTTAFTVLKTGVLADYEPWMRVTGTPLADLPSTLESIPATPSLRRQTQFGLLLPALLLLYSLFWFASGLIGLFNLQAATAVLAHTQLKEASSFLVITGSGIDILIGALLLYRPWVRRASKAAIFVSLGYLVLATLIRPDLWLDPLGPLLKIIPVILTAFIIRLLLEER